MRRSIKSTLVSILGAAIGFISSASATDFYVSQLEGDDQNNGQTPEKAFRTKIKAISNLQPGDKVLFKGGESFEGSLMVLNSGTPDAPITFTSYGNGKAKMASLSEKSGIYVGSNQNLKFINLEVSSSKGRGVLLSETKNGSSNIHFDNLYIHNCKLEGFCSANPNDSNITFSNCTIDNVGGHAIAFYGKGPITLKGNHIKGNGLSSAIMLQGVQKAIFEDNEVSTEVAPHPIFYAMDRKPAFYIADRNKWNFPKGRTMYDGFVIHAVNNRQPMSLSELRRYTGQHANDNRPLVMNPTPQLPQVQPQAPAYQTNQPGTQNLTPFQRWQLMQKGKR